MLHFFFFHAAINPLLAYMIIMTLNSPLSTNAGGPNVTQLSVDAPSGFIFLRTPVVSSV